MPIGRIEAYHVAMPLKQPYRVSFMSIETVRLVVVAVAADGRA